MTFEVYQVICLGIIWVGSVVVAFILGSTHEINKKIKANWRANGFYQKTNKKGEM